MIDVLNHQSNDVLMKKQINRCYHCFIIHHFDILKKQKLNNKQESVTIENGGNWFLKFEIIEMYLLNVFVLNFVGS